MYIEAKCDDCSNVPEGQCDDCSNVLKVQCDDCISVLEAQCDDCSMPGCCRRMIAARGCGKKAILRRRPQKTKPSDVSKVFNIFSQCQLVAMYCDSLQLQPPKIKPRLVEHKLSVD